LSGEQRIDRIAGQQRASSPILLSPSREEARYCIRRKNLLPLNPSSSDSPWLLLMRLTDESELMVAGFLD
jgi:hypothetical protein